MKSRSVRFVVLLLAGLMALALASFAQSDRAAIVGTTVDQNGAVVPGAGVKITNVDTNATVDVTSDSEGRFVTGLVLKIGNYTVEATKTGYKKAVVKGIVLNIGDSRSIELKMSVGGAGEVVEVTASGVQLESETSSRGDVITGRQITELPLRDRNFTNLATLSPGVNRASSGLGVDAQFYNQGDPNAGNIPGGSDSRGSTESARFSRSGGASISANGLKPTNNNFTLDGVDNNEPQFGTIGVFPNPDAIAEFKTETSVGKAESGRGGANVNVTYQSGTNTWHGSGYFYGQRDALNATHPIIKLNRVVLQNQGKTQAQAEALQPKSQIEVNEYGGTLGGPIIKNRTFFFGAFLLQRNSIPNAFTSAVPTAKSRVGDFSEFLGAAQGATSGYTCPNGVQTTVPNINPLTGAPPRNGAVYDPNTAVSLVVPLPVCGAGYTVTQTWAQPFAGNIIPNLQSRTDFSSQAFKMFAGYPLPTINVNNPDNNNPNYFGVRGNQEQIDSFDLKGDQRFGEKNLLTGRFSKSDQTRKRANFFPGLPTAGFGAGNEVGNTRQVAINDTHTFKPTLLNEFRFGWTQIDIGIFNCGVGGACGVSPTYCKDIGVPNCNTAGLIDSGGMLTGGFGNGFFEFLGDGGLFRAKSNNYYIADSVTIVSGRHTWKAGVEIRPRFIDTIDGGRSGGLKGNFAYGDGGVSATGGSNGAANPIGAGNAQANALLSVPIGLSVGKVLGNSPFQLRTTEWSFFVQDDWKYNSQLTFNLGVRYDVFPPPREASGRLSNYDPTTGTLVLAKGSGDRIQNTDTNNFGVRLGAAYAFGKERQFVLRGGYGRFFALDGTDYPPLIRNAPFTTSYFFPAGAYNPNGSNNSLKTGIPAITVVNPPVLTAASGLTVFTTQPTQATPTIDSWNATWQWQFAKNYLLDLGYVGTRSVNLLATRQIGSNFNGLGSATDSTGARINDARAYENRAPANYHALQAKLERRYANGLQFTSAFTWSHNIDQVSDSFRAAGDQRGGNIASPINPLDFSRDRGNSILDRRYVSVTNVIYDLPFGKGKTYGSNAGPALDALIGGWQMNTVFNGSAGQPFTVLSNGTVAMQVSDPFANLASGQYINYNAFKPVNSTGPANNGASCVNNLAGNQVCFGNIRRGQFRGPAFFRTDFSIFKNTTFYEKYKVQLGMEFFNIFNNDNKVVPNNDLGNGPTALTGFGYFGNALPPRTVQFRAKFIF